MRSLWLRFLTEINENTSEFPKELASEKEIEQALEHLHVSAFSKEELYYYDKYWDGIRVERSALDDALEKGRNETKNKLKIAVREKEEAIKKEKEAMKKLAKNMLKYNESIEDIIKETGLSIEEIKTI